MLLPNNTYQYVHISSLIYYEYSFTLILYSNTNFDCCFFCFKQFLTLCFYFCDKIVGSVKDIIYYLKMVFYGVD